MSRTVITVLPESRGLTYGTSRHPRRIRRIVDTNRGLTVAKSVDPHELNVKRVVVAARASAQRRAPLPPWIDACCNPRRETVRLRRNAERLHVIESGAHVERDPGTGPPLILDEPTVKAALQVADALAE